MAKIFNYNHMKKFSYKYEPIKRIKEIFIRQKMKEIAVISKKMTEIKKEIENYRSEKVRAQEESLNIEKAKSSELIFLEHYLQYMDSKIEDCFTRLKSEQSMKTKKLSELTEIYKDLKVISNLKDKYYEDYLVELNRQEQKEFDELASQNFELGG